MTEKLSILDIDNNVHGEFVNFFFFTAFGEYFKKNGFDNISTDEFHEIEFKVNGIELSFSHCMKEIEEQFDKIVEKKAMKLLEDKFDNFNFEINNIMDAAKTNMINSFKKKLSNIKPISKGL